MTACEVCGTEQTPTVYCVVIGDYHATFESQFTPAEEKPE